MHELSIHADLSSVREIGPWLRRAIADVLSPDELESFAMRCELAIHEIAVNIVTHGYAGGAGPDDRITLVTTVVEDAVRVVITDRAEEYRPEEHEPPPADEPQEHGYGLVIVRRLTRRFDLERSDGVNTTTLEFPLPGGQP